MKYENLPEGIDPAAVKSKMEAGLTREQAIQVLQTQTDHDKTLAAASEPSGGVEVIFSDDKPEEQR